MKKVHVVGMFLTVAMLVSAFPAVAEIEDPNEVVIFVGNFDVMFTDAGVPKLPIAGAPNNTGFLNTFLPYPDAPQGPLWNEWYHVPGGFDPNQPVEIELDNFNLLSIIGGNPTATLYFNWSLPDYVDPLAPPSASQESSIGRRFVTHIVNADIHEVEMTLPYTPEWVSVDIMGANIWLNGQIEVEKTPEPISMMMLGCLGVGMTVARKLRRKQA